MADVRHFLPRAAVRRRRQADEKARATVYQNDILLHEDAEIQGPTGIQYEQYKGEVPKGPIVLQGDHGPVQFRNVWIVPACYSARSVRPVGQACGCLTYKLTYKRKRRDFVWLRRCVPRCTLAPMTFLQYAINSMWVVPLVSCLDKAGYGNVEIGQAGAVSKLIGWVGWIGWEYTPLAWAAIISPLVVGMIADRFFASEKVMAVLNVLAGGFLYLAATAVVGPDGRPQPWLFFWLLLAHCLCYMPTWSLTYSITFAHLQEPAKEFPVIRVLSILGWIAASLISPIGYYVFGIDKIEETVWPLKIAALLGVGAGVYDLFLPHTPPPAAGKKGSAGELAGPRTALGLLKDPGFAAFLAASMLIMIPACFYWNYYNDFLVEIKMPFPQLVQSVAQASELIVTMFLSFFLLRMRFKSMVFLGLAAWCLRYLLFACGAFPAWRWTNFVALALHGIAFAMVFTIGAVDVDRKAPEARAGQRLGIVGAGDFRFGAIGRDAAGRQTVRLLCRQRRRRIVGRHWVPYWLWPALMSGLVAGLFWVAFREKIELRPKRRSRRRPGCAKAAGQRGEIVLPERFGSVPLRDSGPPSRSDATMVAVGFQPTGRRNPHPFVSSRSDD